MDDDNRDHPTTDHPLHGEKRPNSTPTLAVIGFVVAFAAIMLLLIWLTGRTG